jgi:hypothetical protein
MNKHIVGLYLLIVGLLVAVGADLFYRNLPPPAEETHSVTLSLTTPPARPAQAATAIYQRPAQVLYPHVLPFAPQPPRFVGDELTCHDEIGTPGTMGFTARSWIPRGNGWCYSADAIQ